jgi:hypothetical protein
MAEHKQSTPFNIYQSILQKLNTDTDRIKLVKRDQELILEGWQIHFAPDPYDIGEFCFPFSPSHLFRDLTPAKVAEISRLQNGRYEVMYNVAHRPILLAPYEDELAATLRWAGWSSFATRDSEFVDHLLSAFHISADDEKGETKETFSQLTDDDMSSVLVVATNVAATGVKRLGEVVNNLAVHGSLDNRPARKLNLKERREVIDTIINQSFEKYFEDNRSAKGSVRSKSSIEGNNRKDARAFDQLLQFNQIHNKEKHLILYFSSAPKSLYLDRTPELKKYYPHINNEPYDLVRTATDLFVYMVYKGDTPDPIQRTKAAKYRLNELEKLLGKIENIKDAFEEASLNCLHCNEDIKKERCVYGTLCDGVKKYGQYIEQREELNVNYSLQKRVADILEKTSTQSARNKHRSVLIALQEVLDEKVKAKNQEMEVVLQSSINMADFLSTFVNRPKREKVRKVSCYLNSYPVCLIIRNKKLHNIVKKVLDLFETGWDKESFKRYVGEYLEIDIELNRKGGEPESELVRCFLYLVMNRPEKAKQIAEYQLESDVLDEDVTQEFRYLLCYILWRLGKFAEAIQLAAVGAEMATHGGKFFHCRSLFILSLIEGEPNQTTYAYKHSVADVEQAIKEFSNDHHFFLLNDMLGVCHNNLAYYFSDPAFDLVDVAAAERHLNELMHYIGEEKWDAFSEFYHTKSSVMYRKFVTSPLIENRAILDEALKSATRACELYQEKPEHGELLKVIKMTYERFKMTEPKD